MSNERLNIPKQLKVGYQKRRDTYSEKLAYVTYINKKGEIAKQISWDGWRDKEITPDDFENVPTEGFVLNKRAGGYKSGWNFRQTKCRVWDPRGFEIEISIENLLYILQECTSTKGKGLEGAFVYAWNGPELILLPTCCEDYICSTELQNRQEKIAVKDLKVGASYKGKEYDYLIYIGKMDWYIWEEKEEKKSVGAYRWQRDTYETIRLVKMSTFVNLETQEFIGYKKTDKLDYLIEENVITLDEVATYVEKYKETEAYKSQGLSKLVLNYNQTEWKKFLNGDINKYYSSIELLFQKPGEDNITLVRCEERETYKGYTLNSWLTYKKVNTYYSHNTPEYAQAKEEFEKGKKKTYAFKHLGVITFKDGNLKRENTYYSNSWGDNYNLLIPQEDWQYLADSEIYSHRNISFLNKDNEVIKYWCNGGVSTAKIKFK